MKRLLLLLSLFLTAPALAQNSSCQPFDPCTTDLTEFVGVLKAANFNSTADQAIAMPVLPAYTIDKILVSNCSINMTTAAGGVYSAVAKGGSAVVAAGQVYSALTASTKFLSLTIAAVGTTDIRTESILYLSLTTGQGAPATCDVRVFVDPLR